MPDTTMKREAERPAYFDELDRVRLTRAISAEGQAFAPGLMGTVVLCHGHEAYEVEFDGVRDVFGVPAGYLEKA